MGIFQARPEEPDEWAGLPSEPWEPRSACEQLPPPTGDLGTVAAHSVSIAIPVTPTAASVTGDDGDA